MESFTEKRELNFNGQINALALNFTETILACGVIFGIEL